MPAETTSKIGETKKTGESLADARQPRRRRRKLKRQKACQSAVEEADVSDPVQLSERSVICMLLKKEVGFPIFLVSYGNKNSRVLRGLNSE